MKKSLVFILLLVSAVFADHKFVLQNDAIMLDKTVNKIEEMASELFAKTGVAFYLSAVEKLPDNESIVSYNKKVASELKAPYALITVSRIDQQIEFSASSDLGYLKADTVLSDYIIPLFVERRKDIGYVQQMSAGLLNGSAYVIETVAEKQNIILDSAIGSESKNAYDALMWVIKIMAALTLLAFFLAWRRSKKEAQ